MIDYGRNLTCNRDLDTGIRYGIVSMNAIAAWVWEEAEPIYWQGCGCCGTEIPEDTEAPYTCSCGEVVSEDDQWGDEPTHWEIVSDGVVGRIDSDGDLWVFESPHTGWYGPCSPCAPGAVDLRSDRQRGKGILGYTVPLTWWAGD